MRTVDLTPPWADVVPSLITLLDRGTPEARQFAKEELARMAERADKADIGKALRPLPALMLHMARNVR